MTDRRGPELDRDARFWRIMTSPVPATRMSLCHVDLNDLGERHVQPFEALVTETLARSCPDLKWTVSQVSGDEGVDLLGEARPIRCVISAHALTMSFVVVGQVKRSKRFSFERAAGIIDRIIDFARSDRPISQFLVVISAQEQGARRYRERIVETARERLPGVPTSVIDATEFLIAWRQDPSVVLDSMTEALSPTDLGFFADYLEGGDSDPSTPGWRLTELSITGPRIRGAVLEIRTSIVAPTRFPRLQVGFSWQPGPHIEVVRPLPALSDSPGRGVVRVLLDDRGRATLTLRFRAARVGENDIGKLCLVEGAGWRSGSGRPAPSLQLGCIEIEQGFLPDQLDYYMDPQIPHTRRIDDAVSRALAGGAEFLAVVGPGGVGKSRLIDEIIDQIHVTADQQAASTGRLALVLQVARDTERSASRRFLLDLVLGLTGQDANPLAVRAGLKSWFARFTRGGEHRIDTAIDSLTGRRQTRDPEATAFALTAAVVLRSRDCPVVLHLANMHWADNFEIAVISDVIHRLRASASSLFHGVLIILEGRIQEMLDVEHSVSTTNAWEHLRSSNELAEVRLTPWSQEHSHAFVSRLFTQLGGPNLDEQRPLIRSTWRRLEDHVVEHSAGNPLHMIEHVRLLLESGVIATASDGTATIVRSPENREITARSLSSLVLTRIEYARRTPGYQELVALLRLMAEIGSRVDQDLFQSVAGALTDSRVLWRIEDLGVACLPSNRDPAFRFSHETYRFSLRRIPWVPRSGEKLRKAALRGLGPANRLAADRLIPWARLVRLGPTFSLEEVRDRLLRGLSEAEAGFDLDRTAAICRELLTIPEAQLAGGPRSTNVIRKALADALIGCGDWEEALSVLDTIRSGRDRIRVGLEGSVLAAEVTHDRANLLGDAMRAAEGIDAVVTTLSSLDLWLTGTSKEELICTRELLLNRLGVLFWFSGRLDLGIRSQYRALASARIRDPRGPREALFLCETGTALLHRYPQRGRAMLHRARELYREHKALLHPTLDYIEAQYEMARLVQPTAQDTLESIEQSAIGVAEGLERPPSVYGAALGWLVAAAAAFVDARLSDSRQHLEEALWWSTRSRNRRVSWKVHLGLASIFGALGEAGRSDAHARLAMGILLGSLTSTPVSMREAWAATLRLPLEHARRCLREPCRALEDHLDAIDRGSPPPWAQAWELRPRSLSRAHEPFQILHVRNGAEDLFLMG